MWIWILIMAASVLVDQVTKQLALRYLAEVGSVEVIPGVFRFTYVENRGAAFGMLSEHRWVFMAISAVAIIGLFIYLWKFPPKSKLACASLALIVGGGIGNMIDRVYLDYVIDFLDFCAFPNLWVWVFNVADACVCVGGGILFVWCIVSMIRESRAAKRVPQGTSPADAEARKDEEAESKTDDNEIQ